MVVQKENRGRRRRGDSKRTRRDGVEGFGEGETGEGPVRETESRRDRRGKDPSSRCGSRTSQLSRTGTDGEVNIVFVGHLAWNPPEGFTRGTERRTEDFPRSQSTTVHGHEDG